MNNISLTDITIHVDQALDTAQRQEIENEMRSIDGVVSVRQSDDRPHLLLVEYNPERTTSESLLAVVTNKGYQAERIGL